jgi:general secretion pathway protein D
MILFKGPPEVLAEIKIDLGMVDTNPPHILVDLMAVELSDAANRSLGLDWSYAGGHFGIYQPVGRSLQKFSQTTTEAGYPSGALDTLSLLSGVGQTFYQGVGTLPSEFFIRLNTLVKDGEGTILANPRTVAMSGKESLINIRKTLNYFFNEGFDVSGRPIVKKSDISADTEGRIVPTLLADGKIHLKVEVKVGNFTFTPDAGLPELTTRQSNTEVTVQEGQTLVLGGLRQQEMSNTTSKVPILGDLPILGGLFKHEETEIKNSVLTIFITPHVLRSGEAVPEWPQLNSEKHKLVPIMEKPLRTKQK